MTARLPRRVANAGLSMIELLVSMAIALVMSLAITMVMVRSASDHRSTASVNDISQTGAFTAYVIDRAIRGAGAGFAQNWRDAFGCQINAKKSGTVVLPRPAAFSASSPFANVSQTFRLAPVVIGKDLADTATQVRGDVLTVMASTGGFSGLPQQVLPGSVTTDVTPNYLRLTNTLGFQNDDLVLLADAAVPQGCMLQQVTFVPPAVGGTDQFLTLGGDFFNATGATVSLADFGASTVVAQLGTLPNNPPVFQLFGVGESNTLFGYDILQTGASDDLMAIADGVVEMRAVYGLDTTTPLDGVLDTWVDPVSGSGYDAVTLLDGTTASQEKLRRIVAIRLGFILRTALQERDAVTAATTLTLFSDLPATLHQTRAITGSDLQYRFRTVELTIPLRNVLLAPST